MNPTNVSNIFYFCFFPHHCSEKVHFFYKLLWLDFICLDNLSFISLIVPYSLTNSWEWQLIIFVGPVDLEAWHLWDFQYHTNCRILNNNRHSWKPSLVSCYLCLLFCLFHFWRKVTTVCFWSHAYKNEGMWDIIRRAKSFLWCRLTLASFRRNVELLNGCAVKSLHITQRARFQHIPLWIYRLFGYFVTFRIDLYLSHGTLIPNL